MANVQMNTRVPEDIKAYLDGLAAKDDRDRGYVLNKLIRPMMEGHEITPFPRVSSPKPGGITRIDLDGNEYQTHNNIVDDRRAGGSQPFKGDSHKQQSLIPKIDKTGGFEAFWHLFPKKKAKAEALKAWVKNNCYKIDDDIFKDLCNRVKNDPSWSDKQFIPNGSTYLNGKRWEDEIIPGKNAPTDLSTQEYKGGSI